MSSTDDERALSAWLSYSRFAAGDPRRAYIRQQAEARGISLTRGKKLAEKLKGNSA